MEEEYRDKYYFGGLRELVLKRDKRKCVKCGMTDKEHRIKWGRAITIDHIDGNGCYVPKRSKNNTLKNLQTLCLKCHGRKDMLKGKYCRSGRHLYIPKNMRFLYKNRKKSGVACCKICEYEKRKIQYHLRKKSTA